MWRLTFLVIFGLVSNSSVMISPCSVCICSRDEILSPYTLRNNFRPFSSALARDSRLIDNYYAAYFDANDNDADAMYGYEGYNELYDDQDDGYYDDDEMNDLYDGDYYDDDEYNAYNEDADEYYGEDYYDEEYDGDEYYDDDDEEYDDEDYYDGDYYDEDYYDEDLQNQIAALQNYYDLNMDQYQRAYNQKYMNLMNAYNRLLYESNLYTDNFYDRMNGMEKNPAVAMDNVANAYNEYDNELDYYY